MIKKGLETGETDDAELKICKQDSPSCVISSVFAHFGKCGQKGFGTPHPEPPRGAFANAACGVCHFRRRRYQFPHAASTDFAREKVCKNAMKWPVLTTADGNSAIAHWLPANRHRLQPPVAELVPKRFRFKRVFPKKWPQPGSRPF